MSDPAPPSRRSSRIDRWQAILLELVLGVQCMLLIAGGFILFDSHSRPAMISFAAGALAGLAGVAVHYRYVHRNARAIAWRFLAPLAGFYFLMLAGVGLTWSEWRGDLPKPLLDIAPRSLVDFAPNSRTGVGLTFRAFGTAPVYSVTSNVSVAVLPFPLPPRFPMPPEAKAPESNVTLAPGGKTDGFGSLDDPITMEQILAILDGRGARLYVGGSLRYRLASGQACVRRFLFQTGGPELVAAIKAFGLDHHTPPPWWAGDRFNTVNKACA